MYPKQTDGATRSQRKHDAIQQHCLGGRDYIWLYLRILVNSIGTQLRLESLPEHDLSMITNPLPLIYELFAPSIFGSWYTLYLENSTVRLT
jgi:hypothetical protein